MEAESHDFVIVGGGTAGLVLAARLSEDPNVKVLVLEAGEDLSKDQRVLVPPMWPQLINSSADWSYKTVPQKGLDGRVVGIPQGRLLGGSGALNGLVFTPPSKAVVDGWASLGNPGWEWEAFSKSFEKSYTLGSKEGQEDKGSLKLNLADLSDTEWPQIWKDTLGALNLEGKGDPFGGEIYGCFQPADNINPEVMQRSYSGNAYLDPAQGRENLVVITQAFVEKVLFSDSQTGESIAEGVQYFKDGERKTVLAGREVILCAGAIHSPKILELSGVGNPERLKDLGINVIIENPHVGENLQTHLMCTLTWEINDNSPKTMDDLMRQDPTALRAAMEAFAQKRGPLARSGSNAAAFLPLPGLDTPEGKADVAELFQADIPWESSETPLFAEAYSRLVRSMTSSPTEPSALYFSFPGYAAYNPDGTRGSPPGQGGYYTIVLILSHPRSSGSIHISKNSAEDPGLIIDPRYLTNKLDLEVMARHVAYIEKIASTEPLASKLKANGHRYPEAAPAAGKLTNLNAARDFIKQSGVSAHHFVGSCSMMPRELGGVVDHELRLHGCRNLRVCDASAIPINTSGNTQSAVYGFAEHAANIIKSGIVSV